MKKVISFFVFACVSLFLIFILEYVKYKDGKLHLVFCNVGQGDAVYIRGPNGIDMLVDGGPSEAVLDCLSDNMPFWDRTIELVFLTHEHEDHMVGVLSVLKRYKVTHFATQNQASTGIKTEKLKELLAENTLTANYLKKGDRIDISGQIEIEAIWPLDKTKNLASKQSKIPKEVDNDSSLVLLFNFKNFNFLITGDVPASKFSERVDLTGLEVIKVPHHGGRGSLDEYFFKQYRPEIAVISVGKNSYGHPSKEITELLVRHRVKTLRTDKSGDIKIISDGKTWKVDVQR